MERLLSALLTVAVVSALAGAGTHAALSDTESSSENLVAAGTLDFTLEETLNVPFDFLLAPGGSTGVVEIDLESADEHQDPNHTEVRVVAEDFVDGTVEPGGNNSGDAFAEQIRVNRLKYKNGGFANLLDCVDPAADGDAGNISLLDVERYGVFDYDDHDDRPADCGEELADLHLDASATFETNMSLRPTTGNTYQGDAIQVDYRFGAAQQAGQDVLG